ncbi:MAG: hypothetical protein K8J09_15090, partial [Planctomycetes bacterium]|nr:hypothetical protein [Planctomycetota bacterium]
MRLLTTGPLLLLVACATPEFAQFSPLPATIVGHRETRPLWSLVVPDGWQVRNSDADVLHAFEAPPKNGRHLVYRTLHVATAAAVAADDDGGLGEAAQRLLIERRANDEFVVQERGTARLGGRDAWFVRGTMRGPSAGWRRPLRRSGPARTAGPPPVPRPGRLHQGRFPRFRHRPHGAELRALHPRGRAAHHRG